MAISQDSENGREVATPKPVRSPVRRLMLLLLLLASIAVFALDFLPEDDTQSRVVGPARKKQRPAAQAPGPSPVPAPVAPGSRPAPAAPVPSPPQYERPPATVLVSSSPSDLPAGAESTLAAADAGPQSGEPAGPGAASAATVPAAAAQPEAVPPEAPVATTAPATAGSAAEAAKPAARAAVETAPMVAAPAVVAPVGDGAAAMPAAPDAASVVQPVAVAAAVEPSSPSPPPRVARPLPTGPVPVKVARYTRRLFDRYDANGDDRIDAQEQRQMQGDAVAADYDGDGEVRFEELAAYAAQYGQHRRMRLTGTMVDEAVAELPPLYIPTAQLDAAAALQEAARQAQATPGPTAQTPAAQQALAEAPADPQPADEPSAEGVEAVDKPASSEADHPKDGQPPAGQVGSKRFVTPAARLSALPDWFRAGDADGDGQLTLAEYAPDSQKARLTEFARYDRNNDGVLTAQECPQKK
ncbi:MAG: EF-hand domain-containing protein [Thermoguttaceae bacterium]